LKTTQIVGEQQHNNKFRMKRIRYFPNSVSMSRGSIDLFAQAAGLGAASRRMSGAFGSILKWLEQFATALERPELLRRYENLVNKVSETGKTGDVPGSSVS